MFCGIADSKGEEVFKSEPCVLKFILSMCTDTDWKIR